MLSVDESLCGAVLAALVSVQRDSRDPCVSLRAIEETRSLPGRIVEVGVQLREMSLCFINVDVYRRLSDGLKGYTEWNWEALL